MIKNSRTWAAFGLTLISLGSLAIHSANADGTRSGGTLLYGHTCNVQLKSTNGTVIALRYRVISGHSLADGDSIYMDGIGLYASGPELQPYQRVRFVLISRDQTYPSNQEVRTVDASYEYKAYGFEAAAADIQLQTWRQYGGHRVIELAVVADGAWLKDPISGSSNFRIDLSSYKDSCANPN